MSMSDSAEYWFNKNNPRPYNTFRHALKINCGHNHNVTDTEYIGDVECHACKKIIAAESPDWMKPGKAPETYYMSKRQKKDYNAQKRFREQYGVCDCGCDFVIRKNSHTGNDFLGCSNFPTCKKTKSMNLR